jgi:hypothetical protein
MTENKDASKRVKGPVPGTEGPMTESKQPTCWYFAIGSMINPTSMKLRDLIPVESHPGELKGYELQFRGPAGMGSVNAKEGGVTYGVLHLLTEKDMAALDVMETGYLRIPGDVQYGDKVQKANVYQMDESRFDMTKFKDALPQERYIDIITLGAIHYKCNPKFVEWLKTVKTQPRKKPSELRSLPNPPDRKITKAELASSTGADSRELWVCINGKVLKWIGDLSNPGNIALYEMAKRFSGKEGALGIARAVYEPKFPVAETYADMPAEHRALVEDAFFGWAWSREPPNYTPIGRLTDE